MTDQSSSFWQKVLATTEQALESGALQPISTQFRVLADHGIPFGVRVLDSLNRKETARKTQQAKAGGKPFNPFLPYEEALFVDQLSQTHVCLLNKFNVVDHHLLIVTRQYESQDTWLNPDDFEALASCMFRADGLGFYNGGTQAGASQHHKHLQLVPLSANTGQFNIPISTLVNTQKEYLANYHTLPKLPFHHSVHSLTLHWTEQSLAAIGHSLHRMYQQIMAELGQNLLADTPDIPYNLLITRDWMMGIERSQATYQGIGVNSLGYAGWLLVKDLDNLKQLEQIGPINLLRKVGCPLRPNS